MRIIFWSIHTWKLPKLRLNRKANILGMLKFIKFKNSKTRVSKTWITKSLIRFSIVNTSNVYRSGWSSKILHNTTNLYFIYLKLVLGTKHKCQQKKFTLSVHSNIYCLDFIKFLLKVICNPHNIFLQQKTVRYFKSQIQDSTQYALSNISKRNKKIKKRTRYKKNVLANVRLQCDYRNYSENDKESLT